MFSLCVSSHKVVQLPGTVQKHACKVKRTVGVNVNGCLSLCDQSAFVLEMDRQMKLALNEDLLKISMTIFSNITSKQNLLNDCRTACSSVTMMCLCLNRTDCLQRRRDEWRSLHSCLFYYIGGVSRQTPEGQSCRGRQQFVSLLRLGSARPK